MHRVSRLGVATVTYLCLTIVLGAGPMFSGQASLPVAGRAPHPFPPGSVRLYRFTAGWNALRPLNARSLADLPGSRLRLGFSRAMQQNPALAVTSDGSRFAVMYELPHHHWPVRAGDLTLQLFDAITGKPLSARHHPDVPVWINGISADGSVVYGFIPYIDPTVPCAPSSLYLLDARTGQMLQRLRISASPWDWNTVLMGPNLQHLYTMTTSDHINLCGPQWSYSPTITAYDLRTGKQTRLVRLKSVPAGRWLTARKIKGQPIDATWEPGFALSPDGSQLAVLDGRSNTLTLLDAQSLRVVGTEQLSRPRNTLQTVAGLLGLSPDAAEAKGESDGVNLQMQYTADGHSLIVTGSRLLPDSHHPYSSYRDLGIRLIDIATGRVMASLRDGKRLMATWLAPDGSAVYTTVQGWTRQGGWQATLRRHDPATLQVRASRTFPTTDYPFLFFMQGR